MSETLKDVNKYLFDELRRLADAEPQQIEAEVKRANSVSVVAKQIIDAHKTQLEAVKLIAEHKGMAKSQKPALIPQELAQLNG